MSSEDVKRKLTAILSADVQGYSRLMGDDEEATVETINAYRKVMTDMIQTHHGSVKDAKGDNVLAEFPSVVDAIQCAVEIQKALEVRNADLPEHRRMTFRIGVNLGDVIEKENTIYGDGVNIAARLESLAEGGGICISGTAFDQVGKKLPLGYKYLGEQKVKNIVKPIRTYKVLLEPESVGKVIGEHPRLKVWHWTAIYGLAVLIIVASVLALWEFYVRPDVAPASVSKMAHPLPDKPSIAVLPFDNMSKDPEQDYFCDGITEEIITGLSKVPRLFVIARNSTFTYKGKPVNIQQVAEDLGVRYVLEGSVRREGDRVRITAQLIDAISGRHLWAEKYDRDLKDIFALQDEIMMKVIAALQVKLTEGEQAFIVAGGTENFEAYVKFLQGIEYSKRLDREGNLLARKMAEEAIALDPNYPRGHRLLGTTHWIDVQLGISKSPKRSLIQAAKLYQKVIAMDPTDAVAHALLGLVYTMMRQWEKGLAEAEKAVALNPNAADAQAIFGVILRLNGRYKEAIEVTKKSIRLNPFPPNWYFMQLGQSYCDAGMYEEAIAPLKKAIRLKPNMHAHVYLTATYISLGREKEAHAEVEEVLKIKPKFSLNYFRKIMLHKNKTDNDRIIDALRKAGLK
jgi:adenylate cyclase